MFQFDFHTSFFSPGGWKEKTSDPSSLILVMLRYDSFFCLRTDLEPPKISSCPENIHITSKKKMNRVLLPGVNVTDNVGVHLFTTNRKNGSEFTWGEHNVTYVASDVAGNIAKCHFQVIITGM